MPRYFVQWEIDIEADTPELAALEALKIQRDCNSLATFFNVSEGRKPLLIEVVQAAGELSSTAIGEG